MDPVLAVTDLRKVALVTGPSHIAAARSAQPCRGERGSGGRARLTPCGDRPLR